MLRACARAALIVAWLSLSLVQWRPAFGQPTSRVQAAQSSPQPAATPKAEAPTELQALREEVALLATAVDELKSGAPPPWAEKLDQRIERVARLIERVAARVETPVPRLDEPFTLLTVAACMLVLGILLGRRLRRGDRRDPRLRL